MKDFKTVAGEGNYEINIQKSRFIGHVVSVSSEEDAIAFIEKIKKAHWNATHNVPVYLIGADYKVQRYSDDGEPSGTAGIPVMEMLKKEGITNICIVITRYFGGIKLGTGGLVRAYTDSAKAVLEHVGVIEKRINYAVDLIFDYTLHGKMQNFCINHEGIIIADTQFTDKVAMRIFINPVDFNEILGQLVDITSDKISISDPEPCYLTFRNDELIKI